VVPDRSNRNREFGGGGALDGRMWRLLMLCWAGNAWGLMTLLIRIRCGWRPMRTEVDAYDGSGAPRSGGPRPPSLKYGWCEDLRFGLGENTMKNLISCGATLRSGILCVYLISGPKDAGLQDDIRGCKEADKLGGCACVSAPPRSPEDIHQ